MYEKTPETEILFGKELLQFLRLLFSNRDLDTDLQRKGRKHIKHNTLHFN